ncbi:phosphatase PAP2 family protein [Flaviaesturariibacter amylovorans]|uniref:Phosphatidic acid phosphatase type 2/haloperoxidase domain-containing protein n=1 Tax=Flaviaesturariibacter amylovorans TaxID=1084520 RepID=A0ABP8GH57_9BACT
MVLCAAPAGAQEKKVDTVVSMTAEGAAKAPGDRELKQIVYKVNPWGTLGSSVAMTLGNMYAIKNILHAKEPISPAEIAALRPELFNGIDRWALRQNPAQRDQWFKISDLGLQGSLLASFSVLLDKNVRKDWTKILMMFYQTQAVTFTTYNFSPLGPSFQSRFRPIVYYEGFNDGLRLRGGNRNSLFSGHVANAAAATFFAAKVYTDYHPEIGKKRFLLYGLAAVPPLFVGYARIKALAHYPSDVIIGFLVGSVAGIGIPALHKIRPKTVQFGITSTEFGTGPSITWKPKKKSFKKLNTFNAVAVHSPHSEVPALK